MQANPQTHARSSALLDDCRDLVLASMQAALNKFFDNSYIAFQEFAGKAQSDSLQIRFMEAMSIIERNRSRVEGTFLEAIRRSFAGFGSGQPASHAIPVMRGSRLSLQSMEECDIQVALQNMVESACVSASHNLNAIRQRLSVLNNGRLLEEDAIPGGPQCLANAFDSALATMVLEHETRLVVYFLFDRVVMRKSYLLYEEYNQRLVRAGILPNLIYEVHKNPVPAHSAPRPSGGHADTKTAAHHRGHPQAADNRPAGESLSDVVFQDILSLMSRSDRQPGGIAAGNDGNSEALKPLPRSKLVSALTSLQRNSQGGAGSGHAAIPEAAGNAQQEQFISSMVSQLSAEREHLFNGIDRRRLPSIDIKLIELVGMMFEYMLRDENLPSVAKAELSRLHTPYLKVAVLDNRLFTNSEHPAHALLNALAEAATKWVFPGNLERGIFPCLCHIVQRIIDEFDTHLGIFDELLGFLANTVKNLEDRAAAIEERSRQAAAGKEKLAVARERAARAIELRVTGHKVPTALRKVLGDIWLDKLMFIFLREPDADNSPAWQLATQAIESIVWSVEPRDSRTAREELQTRLPDLHLQLVETLDTLAVYGSSDNSAQLKLIRSLQQAAAAGAVEKQMPADTRQAAAVSAQDAPAEAERAEDDPAAAEKMNADEVALTAAEEQALEALRDIRFGSWFVFEQDGDRPAQRVKLSWFSQVSGNYMFVDGMGVRAVTCKHHELAALLVRGKARIIDNEQQPFIQRTLRRIRKLLGSSSQ